MHLALEGAFRQIKDSFLANHSEGDLGLLERAFKGGKLMHVNQRRLSGEPCCFHPLAGGQEPGGLTAGRGPEGRETCGPDPQAHRGDDAQPTCPPVFSTGDNELGEAGAVADALGVDAAKLNADRFYRNMDAIHGRRVEIETVLYGRDKSLFNRQGQSLLY